MIYELNILSLKSKKQGAPDVFKGKHKKLSRSLIQHKYLIKYYVI